MLNDQASKRRPSTTSPKARTNIASKTKIPRDEAAIEGPSADEASPDDVRKHATMIKSCGRERNLPGAVQVFNKLKQSGVHMNALIYNCLIDACVQCATCSLQLLILIR